MRAQEFINESKSKGKLTKRQGNSSVGLDVFRDKEFADRIYELNRVMMAAAMADGINPIKIDHESWAGRQNVAAPYSPVEQKMLAQAFAAVGSTHSDLAKGDLRSLELPNTNTVSPVTGFKGFGK
jgi:hypothetical protein